MNSVRKVHDFMNTGHSLCGESECVSVLCFHPGEVSHVWHHVPVGNGKSSRNQNTGKSSPRKGQVNILPRKCSWLIPEVIPGKLSNRVNLQILLCLDRLQVQLSLFPSHYYFVPEHLKEAFKISSNNFQYLETITAVLCEVDGVEYSALRYKNRTWRIMR